MNRFKCIYKTPQEFDDILLESDGEYLTRLEFIDSNNINIDESFNINLEVFKKTFEYLDIYFRGDIPSFLPKYKLENVSKFTLEVLKEVSKISYGEISYYSKIANIIAKKRNVNKMSNQAIGHAISLNPICIIIPCHRIINKNNKLGGYKGGLKNKKALLEIERNNKNEKM